MHFNAHRQQPAEAAIPRERHVLRWRRRRAEALGLLALAAALLLVAPAAGLAAGTTTGYNQTPPPPKTETTATGYKQTPPAPKTETTPAKQEVAPKEEKEAASKSTPSHEVGPTTGARASTSPHARAGRLPFTGLDLRWLIGGGVLLLGSGLSIMVAQRSRRGQRS